MAPPSKDWKAIWEAYFKACQETGITQRDWCGQNGVDVAGFSKKTKQYKAEVVLKPGRNIIDSVIRQEVRKAIADNRSIAKDKLDSALPMAADKLVQLTANCDNENVSLRAAESILDRGGLATPKEAPIQINAPILFANISPKELGPMLGVIDGQAAQESD